jgi:hypothetical protein
VFDTQPKEKCMIIHRTSRVAAGVVLTIATGGLVLGLTGSASAQQPEDGPADGVASMSSPYVPNVPHVPSTTLLVLGPDGSLDGARYVGPRGSVFNGPVGEVETRVDAWWAERMASGMTPEKADELLAGLTW